MVLQTIRTISREIWKWIPGYQGWYKASTHGRIKSVERTITICNRKGTKFTRRIQTRILDPKPSDRPRTYLTVLLCKGTEQKEYCVHDLILLTFKGPKPKGMEARHFPDRNPFNNNINNLGYCTPKINSQDRITHGTQAKGETHGSVKLTDKEVKKIRKWYKQGKYNQYQLSWIFDCDQSTISKIISRKSRKEV